MADLFANNADAVFAPARKMAAVTPSDSTDLADIPKALFIGVGGTLTVTAADDSSSVLLTVSAGVVPVRAKRVYATGTTATGIVALY